MISIGLHAYPHKWQFCSNDDPIFGQVSLSDTDELWSSSSKDLHSSPRKLFPTVESKNLDSGSSRQNDQLSTLASGRSGDAGSLGLPTGSAMLTYIEEDTTGALAKHRVLHTLKYCVFCFYDLIYQEILCNLFGLSRQIWKKWKSQLQPPITKELLNLPMSFQIRFVLMYLSFLPANEN